MIRNSPLLHYKAHRTALASTTFVKLIFPAIPIGGPIKVLLCLYVRAVWTASRYFITCIRQQVERVVPGMLFLPCEVEAFLGREKKKKNMRVINWMWSGAIAGALFFATGAKCS